LSHPPDIIRGMSNNIDKNEAANAGEKDGAKLRADSNWSGLTGEQRQTLERWLFEENLSYKETLERAKKELGIEASLGSLQRFRRRVIKERTLAAMSEAEESAAEVNGTKASLERLRTSAWKVVGKQFLEKAMEGCDIKELRTLGRLMADSEEREIRCRRLALAREKFQFRAAKAVWKHMPMLNQMAQEDEAREDARIDAIRLAIFGRDPVDEYPVANKDPG
jgi:hypothetical protein